MPGLGGSGVCWKHPSLHQCAGTCSLGSVEEAARDPIIYEIIKACLPTMVIHFKYERSKII